ncbi:hypothetical protein N431DRAFT_207798 [Stipitochalara longipes BDJ]|nr:hypothetical protein N431DRAFT_207798 [Stipitochalara longipes BDJ]
MADGWVGDILRCCAGETFSSSSAVWIGFWGRCRLGKGKGQVAGKWLAGTCSESAQPSAKETTLKLFRCPLRLQIIFSTASSKTSIFFLLSATATTITTTNGQCNPAECLQPSVSLTMIFQVAFPVPIGQTRGQDASIPWRQTRLDPRRGQNPTHCRRLATLTIAIPFYNRIMSRVSMSLP